MKTQNPWKIAFLTLSGMILIFIAALAAYLFSISTGTEDDDFQRPQTEEVEGARFTVSASRDDINYWLERELAESGEGEDYELYLEDLVYFHTEVEALGFNVPVEMELEPVVTDGGNVELISRSFSIAGLGLPSSTVLSLIQGETTFLTGSMFCLRKASFTLTSVMASQRKCRLRYTALIYLRMI